MRSIQMIQYSEAREMIAAIVAEVEKTGGTRPWSPWRTRTGN